MISIIIPVKDEANNIAPLIQSIVTNLEEEHEIIFIDDGSTDNTLKNILAARKVLPQVKVIVFQKNFGKAAGLSAGFDKAKGEIIITMDGDLQDEPFELSRFIEKIREGYDLVSGWKFERKDPLAKTLPSKFFNWLTSFLTGIKIHDFNCGYKAYRKPVVENIQLYGELHRYVPVLAGMKGFKIGEIKVKHNKRVHGSSKYGVSRLFKGFFDLITVSYLQRYYKRPLHFFGIIGAVSFLFGIIGGVYLIILKIMGALIGDRPLLILVVLLMVLGTQFISLGLLAEMVIKNSPEKEYVIREVFIE